jgi:septal ring factor EnvC (AmiA/AmiB activator)
MKRPPRYLNLLCILGVLICGDRSLCADQTGQSTETQAKLDNVRARIAAVTRRLADELKERDALRARLRVAELDMTAKRQKLDALRVAEAALRRRRAELKADADRNQQALVGERDALAALVRAAYLIGPQDKIKLLLTQSDPANAGRMAAFYGYFARARLQRLNAIEERVAKSQELVREIDQNGASLLALQSDTSRELADVEHARAERLAALKAVSLRLNGGSEELAQLKHEEAAEEALLADLARVLQDFPVDSQRNFADLRGKLAWPVEGRLTVRFQDMKGNSAASSVRWNGVLIQAARGAKVRTPYFGRVVYADWLQGLGLLLIIAHSDNYLTLYGHAEVLYKSVGDWVAPGDVIAALGDSGPAAPQLYFEIREGRTPKDPRLWLKPVP